MPTILEVKMSGRTTGFEIICSWRKEIREKFNPVFTEEIVKSLIEKAGGLRISVPDLHDLERETRNARMRELYWKKGFTYEQLAVNFDLSKAQVRRIVNGIYVTKKETQ